MVWQRLQSEFERIGASISRDMREMLHDISGFIRDLGEAERLVLLSLAVLGLFYMLLRRSRNDGEADPSAGYFAAVVLVLVVFGVAAGRIITGNLTIPGLF